MVGGRKANEVDVIRHLHESNRIRKKDMFYDYYYDTP